jgi:hypothetical protein
MKRFQLWLTTAIVFSMPALVFAQATGGSPGKQLENHKGTGTGRKGTAQPEIRKKGTGNAQKNAGTLNPQPLPPINHAPLADKGSGNAPKTTGTTTTPPPKAGTSAGKVYRKGSGTDRKGKVEQTDGGKTQQEPRNKGK